MKNDLVLTLLHSHEMTVLIISVWPAVSRNHCQRRCSQREWGACVWWSWTASSARTAAECSLEDGSALLSPGSRWHTVSASHLRGHDSEGAYYNLDSATYWFLKITFCWCDILHVDWGWSGLQHKDILKMEAECFSKTLIPIYKAIMHHVPQGSHLDTAAITSNVTQVVTFVCVCVRVCMYVCTYVCTYIRMYVYMYVYMYVCMYVCMYVSMYVCKYVCM